ncbi:hypothetical protein MP228_002210 [Amoeboaphelidium protococcarum]|nr:hypothetical protein MP228_002210 [Amoeboaphelidium protococcarum]
MQSNTLHNVNILSILKHPDLPESILQYLNPRDVHCLCTINNEVWRVMTSDLTILKRYYWFYYGPILSLLRLEYLPYLCRCGLNEEMRTFEEVFETFLHEDEVRDCVALHLYVRTMVQEHREGADSSLIQLLHNKFTVDWSGTYDEIQDFGSFTEKGWGRFQLQEDQCLRNSTGHVLVQSRRMYLKVLLRHFTQGGNNVIKWCQLGHKLLHHVTPKIFIKLTWPQFNYNDDETEALNCCSLLLLHVDMPHSAFYTWYHVFVLLHRWGGCLLVLATLLSMVYVYSVPSAKSPLNVSSAASRLSNPFLLCSLGMSLPFRIRHVNMGGTQATQSLGLPFQDDLGPFVVTCSHSRTQPPTHIGFRESYPCRQAEFTFGEKGGLQPDIPAGLSWCGMDDLLHPDHSVERAMFLMCLGILLKSSQEQFVDYFSQLMLRTISCAVSQTRSYQLEAVIKNLSGVFVKDSEQSRTAGRSAVRSHLIRFLTQSFPSGLLMKLVDSGFQQFLHLNMTNARMIQFYMKIWHCLPQHLPGIPLELRRQWVSSLITELIGRYDEVSDNFGGFSTIVFGQCYQTFLSEEFCPVIVSVLTELCRKEAPEYSQQEAEQLFEDLYENDFGDEFPTFASVTWPLKKHVEALQSEAGSNKCRDAVVQQLQQLFEVYEKRNKDCEHCPQNECT